MLDLINKFMLTAGPALPLFNCIIIFLGNYRGSYVRVVLISHCTKLAKKCDICKIACTCSTLYNSKSGKINCQLVSSELWWCYLSIIPLLNSLKKLPVVYFSNKKKKFRSDKIDNGLRIWYSNLQGRYVTIICMTMTVNIIKGPQKPHAFGCLEL